tara:strand:+ start:896 stop:1192 length:297 start_codon:yes stop_codon:yes gene_type:complete
MKSTNQVHDAIERKAKERLEAIADEMTIPLTKLHEQFYSSACSERYDLTDTRHDNESKINYLTKHELKNVLYRMMKDAYLKEMVEKKSKELLEKLELI